MNCSYLNRHCRLVTHDLDQAREYVDGLWERHRSHLRRGQTYNLRWHQADLPQASLSYVDSSSAIRVLCGPVRRYHFTMHEGGRLQHWIDGRETASTPTQAVLHVPGQELRLETEPFRLLLLTFDAQGVDEAVSRRGNRLPSSAGWPIDIALDNPACETLQSLCRWTARELDRPGSSLLASSRAIVHLQRTLLALFLDAVTSQFPLARKADDIDARRLMQIEAWMDAHYAQPIGIEDMAQVAGVSVRSVQTAFRRLRGCTPTEALVRRRLERAHQALSNAAPDTTVTEVALDCGFFHCGRFSSQYQRVFGERPSVTLRRSQLERAAFVS